MVFSSHVFLFYFLPLVMGVYYALPRRGRSVFLTFASYAFYGWWKPWFVLLMLASTVVDYLCGRVLSRSGASEGRRRAAVWASVVTNLGLLGFFKYWMFFAENVGSLLVQVGGSPLPSLEVILPVGISFYTFQSMSYTIDLYRGHARPAPSFVDFAAYVSLFPQLVAGPIIRYRDVAEQLHFRSHTLDKMSRGIAYFAFGLAKKVLVANNVGEVADLVFAAQNPPWHVAWWGVVAYAFQIYFDFSGYSDMAIGLGLMLGFTFPQNFRSPYHSASITEFWRRWHISLSTWLRDYLYIPLGGNRKGRRRTYVNLALTMLLGGLWHGAQWQFVVWGALHGGMLAAERATGREGLFPRAPRPLRVALTFVLVLVTWVFFRAETLGEAMVYLGHMLGLGATDATSSLVAGMVYTPFSLVAVLGAGVLVWAAPRTEDWVDAPGREIYRTPRRAILVPTLLVLGVLEMSVQSHNPFLYFQF